MLHPRIKKKITPYLPLMATSLQWPLLCAQSGRYGDVPLYLENNWTSYGC